MTSEAPDFKTSDDETLALLEEVRDYLLRLPVVPMTRDLARRVDDHINRQRAVFRPSGPSGPPPLVGHVETPGGAPVLLATLHGRTLRLQAAPVAIAEEEQRLLHALDEGLLITLNRAPWS